MSALHHLSDDDLLRSYAEAPAGYGRATEHGKPNVGNKLHDRTACYQELV
jgi:hypothetical protein